jgi:hypothetical protein
MLDDAIQRMLMKDAVLFSRQIQALLNPPMSRDIPGTADILNSCRNSALRIQSGQIRGSGIAGSLDGAGNQKVEDAMRAYLWAEFGKPTESSDGSTPGQGSDGSDSAKTGATGAEMFKVYLDKYVQTNVSYTFKYFGGGAGGAGLGGDGIPSYTDVGTDAAKYNEFRSGSYMDAPGSALGTYLPKSLQDSPQTGAGSTPSAAGNLDNTEVTIKKSKNENTYVSVKNRSASLIEVVNLKSLDGTEEGSKRALDRSRMTRMTQAGVLLPGGEDAAGEGGLIEQASNSALINRAAHKEALSGRPSQVRDRVYLRAVENVVISSSTSSSGNW